MSTPTQNIHFIAVGGAVMHNLALALHQQGAHVTGSDDLIREPSRGRLQRAGLLPETEGWFPQRITSDLDAVILGMHARADNPELRRAQELKLPVYSFPEYIYQRCLHKQRIVVAGSHGKTTITSALLHVLRYHNRHFDYVVGAQLEGFDLMVRLTDDAPLVVIEGDEYLSSPIDPRPKFLHYHHHIGLVSGIAWDHVNVYPDFDAYARQFDNFADASPKGGTLIYCEEDDLATVICKKERDDVSTVGYEALPARVADGRTYLLHEGNEVAIQVFGHHNLLNLSGAKTICLRIGITEAMFYDAIASFTGAAHRLERVAEGDTAVVFKDFAHAPSKLRATCEAVREQYPDRRLVACLELHTFSSLNPDFLRQYAHTFHAPDVAVVFYNPHVSQHRRLPVLSEADIQTAFERADLRLFSDPAALDAWLRAEPWRQANLLMMSSGTFEGLDLTGLARHVTQTPTP